MSDISRNPNGIIFVGGKDRPAWIASMIAESVRNTGQAYTQAIGANAVNQTVKGLVYARIQLEKENIKIGGMPYFVEVLVDDEYRTAVRFEVNIIT